MSSPEFGATVQVFVVARQGTAPPDYGGATMPDWSLGNRVPPARDATAVCDEPDRSRRAAARVTGAFRRSR
jgi:hypothetical protein